MDPMGYICRFVWFIEFCFPDIPGMNKISPWKPALNLLRIWFWVAMHQITISRTLVGQLSFVDVICVRYKVAPYDYGQATKPP